MFDDLTKGVTGKGADDHDTTRQLVASELLAAERAHVVAIRRFVSRTYDDEGRDLFAPLRRFGTHDGDIRDCGMQREDLFDFAGIHIEATADDELFGTTDDRDVAVRCDSGNLRFYKGQVN